MAFYYRCDESSDDDYLSEDGGYEEFKEKTKRNRVPRILTDAQKLENEKKSFYSVLCHKNKDLTIEYINNCMDVNMDIGDRWTPLLLAVSSGNAVIVEELLNRGADVGCRRDGMTALMMACNCPKETAQFSDSLQIIKHLILCGADPTFTNRKGMTALMFAANVGNLPAVKFLLPFSDINAEDNQRWTALFWAINGKDVEVVDYLLQEGVKYDISDVRNKTPLNIAKNNRLKQIINLFPSEEPEIVSCITDLSYNSFEEIFNQTKPGEQPQFFLDICNFLIGANAEGTIKLFADSKINFSTLLSSTNEDLKNLGVKMPFQRYRILAGIHEFHKLPFFPKSFYVVESNQKYSNIDVAVLLLTTIKQLIILEACVTYITKTHVIKELSKQEIFALNASLRLIRQRLNLCKQKINILGVNVKHWDKMLQPADLITSISGSSNFPWRKVVFSVSLLSVVFIYKKLKC